MTEDLKNLLLKYLEEARDLALQDRLGACEITLKKAITTILIIRKRKQVLMGTATT